MKGVDLVCTVITKIRKKNEFVEYFLLGDKEFLSCVDVVEELEDSLS
jgi:hypothetical protein